MIKKLMTNNMAFRDFSLTASDQAKRKRKTAWCV